MPLLQQLDQALEGLLIRWPHGEEAPDAWLAAAWGQGQKVTVLQAMGMSDDSSPTTVHRRLKSLRKKGFIGLHEDETDNRVKFIEPTAQADEYFARLGQCLEAASKQP